MVNKPISSLQLISVRWWNANAYYAISLAEALHQAGLTSIVGGRGGSLPLQKARELNLPSFNDIDLETYNLYKIIRNILRIKKWMKEENIDLINAHRAEDIFYAVLAKKFSHSEFPVIRSVGDVRPPRRNFINKWLYQNTDFVIFSCKAMYNKYQQVWPIFEDKSTIIYSAIDTDEYRVPSERPPLRKELGIAEEKMVIGIISRLSPVKDHQTFLEAAGILAKKYANLQFLISGEEAQFSHEDLFRVARKLNIQDKVIFLDRQDDIRDLIGIIDIGVVASKGSEVICRISVEYMAMGKPQVVTSINVLPEIIEDGKNGFIVPPGDAIAMAEKLSLLIDNHDLRIRMGSQARQIAESNYSYSALIDKTLQVYQKTLKKYRR
jgi:glycosyltransferase involved in cell wall biosynthesis